MEMQHGRQKGFAHILLFLILLAGLVVGVVLVNKTQIFKSRASGDSAGIITPKKLKPEFTLMVNNEGQVAVKVGDSKFPLTSYFSYPGATKTSAGGWNSFPKMDGSQQNWTVTTTEVQPGKKYSIKGENSLYSITRTVERLDNKIKLSDVMANKSSSDIPLMNKNYINFTAGVKFDNIYLSGIKLSNSNCQPSERNSCSLQFIDLLAPQKTYSNSYLVNRIDLDNSVINGNRTIFYTDGTNGLGLFPEDNVSRVHSEIWVEEPKAEGGLLDKQFMLKPSDTYTKTWYAYPTASADYFDFLNPVRQDLGVNFTITGSTLTGNLYSDRSEVKTKSEAGNRGVATMSNAIFARENGLYIDYLHDNLAAFFKKTGTVYPLINMPKEEKVDERKDANGVAFGYPQAWGSAFAKNSGAGESARLQVILNKIHQDAPDVKAIMYFNRWLTGEEHEENNCKNRDIYPDSRVLNSRRNQYGQAGYYSNSPKNEEQKEITFVICHFYGKIGNSYHQANMDVIEKAINVGFDGIFFDEFDGKSIVDTYNEQDGVSADIDPKSFTILSKKANLTLLTLPAQLALVDYLQSRGKVALANFPPLTKELTEKHFPRFIEERHATNESGGKEAALGQLYTPIVYSFAVKDDARPGVGSDQIHTERIRDFLQYGALMYNAFVPYTFDNNIMQKMFPITPIELHKGYIIGEEKIITTKSGKYGYNDLSIFTVNIYDKNGALKSSKDQTKYNDQGFNYAEIELADDQIAIIERNESAGISGNLYINEGNTPIDNRPAEVVNNRTIHLRGENGIDRVTTTADRADNAVHPGYYVFKGLPLNQTYTITVEGEIPGYKTPAAITTKLDKKSKTINPGLIPANYAISGHLFIAPNPDSRPAEIINNQIIRIQGKGVNETVTTTTREGLAGYFVLKNLLPGEYSVVVENAPSGYQARPAKVTIGGENKNKTVNFGLTESSSSATQLP